MDKIKRLRKEYLKNVHGVTFYPYQEDISDQIIQALTTNLQLLSGASEEDIKKLKSVEIPIEISRQAGKTTAVVLTIDFVLVFLTKQFNKRLAVGIFAPQREQAKTDFVRLKEALRRSQTLWGAESDTSIANSEYQEESNANTLVLANGSSCFIFPVTKTSKPESKTLDLMIFEESQDLEDKIVKEQIWPMGASTNAPRVYIGTAGTRICYFYRLGQSGAVKLYFDDIAEQRRQTYEETGEVSHLIYEQFVLGEIEKFGREADEIERPYFGKWLLGTGQFVTQEALEALVTDRGRTHHENKQLCYVGIDVAKHPDSTVVTVLRDNKELGKRELINWLELRGENYKDQFEIIHDFVSRYKTTAIAIDSTGIGDYLPDLFERETKWQDEHTGLYRIKFTQSSKSDMAKNLKSVIVELLTTLPKLNTKEGERFKQQMLDLQQEWKGQHLSVHHPDDVNAHDDYTDSFMLAEWAYALDTQNNFADIKVIETETNVRQTQEDNGFFGDQWGD